MYYYPLDHLKGELDKLNTKNYRLYNANNFDVPDHVKFDLITSWVSCGFHYPVSTYRELILKHSDQHTRVVMDLRNTVPLESGVTVVNAVNQRRKYTTCEIKIS
jgi:hypothetical protein